MQEQIESEKKPKSRLVTPALATFVDETATIGNFMLLTMHGHHIIRHQVKYWDYFSQYYVDSGYSKEQMEATTSVRYDDLLLELFVTRTVDSYLTYLIELVAQILIKKPEVLRSNETERLDFILRFSTMEELVAALTEKRIERLAYLGTLELAKFFDEKLGLELVDQPEHMNTIVELVEVRNVIVHNHGRISKTFKRRLPNHPGTVGERLQLAELGMTESVLVESAGNLDRTAIAKFGLTNLVPLPDINEMFPLGGRVNLNEVSTVGQPEEALPAPVADLQGDL